MITVVVTALAFGSPVTIVARTTMEIDNGTPSAARVPSLTSTPNSQRAARWPEVGLIEINRWNDSKLIGNIGMAGGYLLMKYGQP